MSTETLTCQSCGSQVPVSALLCPNCGRPNISTAFAGTYSAPQAPQPQDGTPPAGQPATREPQSAGATHAPSAPAGPTSPTPTPAPTPPAPAPGSMGAATAAAQQWSATTTGPTSAREGATTAPSSLPESLRPGPMYAGPNSQPQESGQPPVTIHHPAPQPDTPTAGGRPPGPQATHPRR